MMVGDYMASAAQFDITLDYGWRVRRVEPFNRGHIGP
jgi:hypothetical protein